MSHGNSRTHLGMEFTMEQLPHSSSDRSCFTHSPSSTSEVTFSQFHLQESCAAGILCCRSTASFPSCSLAPGTLNIYLTVSWVLQSWASHLQMTLLLKIQHCSLCWALPSSQTGWTRKKCLDNQSAVPGCCAAKSHAAAWCLMSDCYQTVAAERGKTASKLVFLEKAITGR